MSTVWKVWAITATVLLALVSACSVAVIRDRNESEARLIQSFEDYKAVSKIACKKGICE